MDTKKRNMIIGAGTAAAVILVVGLLAAFGVFRGFNPEGYVKAVLDQSLKGEVEAAAQLMAGTTEDKLYEQYEAGIASFAENSILQGIQIEEEMKAEYKDKFTAVCKKIFASMKYEVLEATEKEDGDGFDVTVSYQPSNVFTNFIVKIAEESQRLYEKADNGEYRGLWEEIKSQMEEELIQNTYTLLEECNKNMEYGEQETYVFEIIKDEEGMYDLDEAQVVEFITKILDLDENQG